MDADERLARLCLARIEGLGAVRQRALLERFGSAQAVLNASRSTLMTAEGIGAKLADQITQGADAAAAATELRRLTEMGGALLFADEPAYPELLKEVIDRPEMLMMRGALAPTDRAAVAIVGSRQCSEYGRRLAQQLASDLAGRGLTIVSGLARGIDAIAHRAALTVGGRTLAVLASGVGNIYPPEHVELADQVCRAGAVLSEAPLDGAPVGKLFPQRNRIISGLSLGVIVVEAAAKSGTLSTALHALDQNRDVFAIPGRVGDVNSEGTNFLIKQGAKMVTSVADIWEQLGPIEAPAPQPDMTVTTAPAPIPTAHRPTPTDLNDVQRRLWDALSDEPLVLEVLLERTQLRASEASSALFMLELRKLVERRPGNCYVRN